MNTSVAAYFKEGCGRCELGGTPKCKVHTWRDELALLREILRATPLQETCKWGVPCYTCQDKNVVLLSAFKDHCSVSFFHGSLLQDPTGLLTLPGPNSHVARVMVFNNVDGIKQHAQDLTAFIDQAIGLVKEGTAVPKNQNLEPIPAELQQKLNGDSAFQQAFEALTLGRKRGYILHIAQAKQAETRYARIEKCKPLILQGLGLHDRITSKK